MNSFEQFTLIIGLLAIVLEAVRHLREKLHAWHNGHHKAG